MTRMAHLMDSENMVSEEIERFQGHASLLDGIFHGAAKYSAVLVLTVIVAIGISLAFGASAAFQKFGWRFIFSTEWNPVSERFGALVSIYGTLVTSFVAMVIAVPTSLGIALFISELAPVWLKRPVGIAVELLAAIPSIIYGMWGLFVFAPIFGEVVEPWMNEHFSGIPVLRTFFTGPPMGIGVGLAGIILAIMVIPFMAAVIRDMFEAVPPVLKESAYGLGATTWEVTRSVILPYSKIGVIGGIMLGLGRAMGETMAVTFVIGNADRIHLSLFEPGNTISSSLANQFTEAVGEIYVSSLIALALILFVITLVVLSLAKLLLYRLAKGEGTKT